MLVSVTQFAIEVVFCSRLIFVKNHYFIMAQENILWVWVSRKLTSRFLIFPYNFLRFSYL